MLWDRVFGTYQKYRPNVKIGLVSHSPDTYDSITLYFGHYKNLFKRVKEIDGFANKLSVIFKGPGWAPGKPRLGCIEDVPEDYPNESKYAYDPRVAYWKKFYVLIHLSIILLAFMELADDSTIVCIHSNYTKI